MAEIREISVLGWAEEEETHPDLHSRRTVARDQKFQVPKSAGSVKLIPDTQVGLVMQAALPLIGAYALIVKHKLLKQKYFLGSFLQKSYSCCRVLTSQMHAQRWWSDFAGSAPL